MSEERRRYVEHLRRVHDEARFRLALLDEIAAEPSDEERFVFEAEMLANYYVA